MGWLKEDFVVVDFQFVVKMGFNIVMEICGNVIFYLNDIKVKWILKGILGVIEYF